MDGFRCQFEEWGEDDDVTLCERVGEMEESLVAAGSSVVPCELCSESIYVAPSTASSPRRGHVVCLLCGAMLMEAEGRGPVVPVDRHPGWGKDLVPRKTEGL